MSEKQKIFLIFEDNLSTKDDVTISSGRGIGMSAIKGEIEKLKGKININNKPNLGVEFIFSIPLN